VIISSEQLHGLLAAIRDQKIAVVEAIGLRPVGPGLVPGEQVRVDVLAKLPSGQSLANLAGQLVNMQLPADVKPGETMRMTYVTGEPRPTFALSQSERQGAPTTVSDTARWLGQITREQTSPGSALPRPAQLLSAPPTSPQQLADRLRQAVVQSGVFYEAHLAEWATGERPLASVLEEPQGTLSLPAAFQKAASEGLPIAQRMAPPATQQTQPAQPTGPPATAAETTSATTTGQPSQPVPATAAAVAPPMETPAGQTPATAAANTGQPTTPDSPRQQPASGSGATEELKLSPRPSADLPLPAMSAPREESVASDTSLGARPQITAPADRQQPMAAAPQPDRQEPPATTPRVAGQLQSTPDRAEQPMEITPRSTHPSSPPGAAPEPGKTGTPLSASEPADPRTIPLIREQLELLQNRTFTWQGEGWPGQPLKWQVEERDANPGEAGPRSWQSSLHLALPRIGEVHATLRLAGKSLNIAITGSSTAAVQELQTAAGKLREQLEAHGLSLNAFEVQND